MEMEEFWKDLREKVRRFEQQDDADVVFGARTRGVGHKYRLLPPVTDREVLTFEGNNGFALPPDYRCYLQSFGAGGAGPNYGILDFRAFVLPNTYEVPFPYDEEVWYDEVTDDDPVWDCPGLAYISDAGCGTEFFVELNGPQPGRIWCSWNEACSPYYASIRDYYREWLEKVEPGLERYQLLKSFIDETNPVDETSFRLRPAGLKLQDVADKLQCSFKRHGREWSSSVAEGETWVHFDRTPGRVVVNERDEVLRIDVFRSCAIS